MLKGIVSNNPSVWQGHPDVAYFQDALYVTYRESDYHMPRQFTQICVIYQHKNQPYSKPQIIIQSKKRLNCPRLSVIDDTLWLICDEVEVSSKSDFFKLENRERATRVFLWKTNDGQTWEGPIKTNITGIVPDRICQTDDGFLIATHTKKHFDEPLSDEKANDIKTEEMGNLVQNVWHATELQEEWMRYPLAHIQGLNLCEASICRLPTTYLALIRENSALGLPAFASYSLDGIKWLDPIKTRMFGCHRPVTGLLKSGNLLTTYREASGCFLPGFWAKNTFACLTTSVDDFSRSIILPLDHDNSSRSDSGYTGWVQLPDESIYIVNYTNKNAKRPYIVWYSITEREF